MRAAAGTKSRLRNVVWESRRPPQRGPKPGLTTAGIAKTAIRIADEEGLGAITMQRVARESRVTTMAIYRYFAAKSDLVAVMIDAAGAPVPAFDRHTAPWKIRLSEWARRCMALYRKHPWLLEATTVRRTMMGPIELSWMEAALALLAEAGLPPKESYCVFLTIMGHIRGHAAFDRLKAVDKPSRKWGQELSQLLRGDSGRYPVLQVTLAADAFSQNPDEVFEYGLGCILEGVDASNG